MYLMRVEAFEGLGLGTRLAFLQLPPKWNWVPTVAALVYSAMTPLGMAIGLGAQGGLVRFLHFLFGSQPDMIVNDECIGVYRWWGPGFSISRYLALRSNGRVDGTLLHLSSSGVCFC
jgi:hypothetical protein